MTGIRDKYRQLRDVIREKGSAVIAYSGGLDSALLSYVSHDVLGDKALAVTAVSLTYSSQEYREAVDTVSEIGISHMTVDTAEFGDIRFRRNGRDRCYWCKRELFSRLTQIAEDKGLIYVFDGTNLDDFEDDRPGLRAKKEFSVFSPLYESRFTKNDIRELARDLGLSFWKRPSGTCLSSRIPFGEEISEARLTRVAAAEDILRKLFGADYLFRGRDHGDLLRIETENRDWTKLDNSDINNTVIRLKELGYKYVAFDALGYIPAGKRK